ncbi:MAG: response regulator transcription factor [Bacteroidales bacterium]
MQNLSKVDADLVLMDISMPKLNGIDATTRAPFRLLPGTLVIALSALWDEEYYYKMIEAGVKGFILKESGKEELEKAIHEVVHGGNYFSQKLLTDIILNMNKQSGQKQTKKNEANITRRELEVLKLICAGMSNMEIAENSSSACAPWKVTNKVDQQNRCKNSISLVLYAIKNNLIEL